MKTSFSKGFALVFLSIGILSLFHLASCKEEGTVNPNDPVNLVVEITLPESGPGLVTVHATAGNAVLYGFYVDTSTVPEETNSTGIFEKEFSQPGAYQIEVRAYGSSGRYLKAIKHFNIEDKDPVNIDQGYSTPMEYDGYQLVWNDEFEGNEVNLQFWNFETGTGCPNNCGWGNNELQFYRQQNATVSGGVLTIEARKESYQGSIYTSSRLKTSNKKSFQYGRVDIRALLPKGQGLWPALWMLGDNISSAGWPKCGEIDIMEMIGGSGRENQVYGTLHWDDNGHVSSGKSFTLSSGTFADEYHVFSIIWDQTYIRWYVNDVQFNVLDITPQHMTEFHQAFFFIFNVAVGGNWPGNPNSSTVFPQEMKVDYVRVFQKTEFVLP